MQKNKNIIWKKYFGKNIKGWIPWFSKVLLDALCATLFLCAARIMLRDVYSWLVLSASSGWMFFTLAIVISAAMELAEHFPDTLCAFTTRLKLYFSCGDREKFLAVMEQLKKTDIIVDKETLELIRVFS